MHLNPTHNDLPKETRHKTVELCNALLADCIDLMLQGKQAHWNVKGAQFIALHELFDKIVEQIEGFVDDIAERAVQLGGNAHGTLQAVSKASKLPPYPLDLTVGLDHVKHFSGAAAAVGKSVREATDPLKTSEQVSRGLDKSLWFLEAHLQGKN